MKHFPGDSTIDTHPAKADAVVCGFGTERAFAGISLRIAALTGVMNMQPSTAARAAEQARQQSLATSYRTTTHVALSIGVVSDQVLVPFKLRPSNITLMVVVDQNLPFLPIAPEGVAHNPLAIALNCEACSSSAVSIGASVNWVGQHVMKRVVDRRLPRDRALAAPWHECWNEDILLPEPK